MINPLLKHPTPDFDEFARVLKGQQEPRRVHLVELGIDEEILQAITERYLDQTWVSPESGEAYFQQRVNLFY